MKKLLVIFGILLNSNVVTASHLMGGEITWECQANGSFKFTMKVYRDCNGITFTGNGESLSTTHPTIGSIPLTLISSTDISAQGPGCSPCSSPGPGSSQEFIMKSGDVFLNGTPPAQGWVFSWSSCCRNSVLDPQISNAGTTPFIIRAVMYPYNNLNMNPCFDSSPFFIEKPWVVMCTRNPTNYIHHSIDDESDSLVYDWGEPFAAFGQGVTYNYPYTYNNPLPQPFHHPLNESAIMDPNTGEVTFKSYTQGYFLILTKVTSYKCGIILAEIYREIQIILMDCIISQGPPVDYNKPPDVNAPFQNPFTGLYEWYSDTVNAGDAINFFLNATDFEFTTLGTPQTVTLNASGSQFGAGFTDPNNGCLIPPCATLMPIPPVSSAFGVGTSFQWQTDCGHLEYDSLCGTLYPKLYVFNFGAKDDFCPANSVQNTVVTILVNPAIPCITGETDNPEIVSYFQILAGSEETEFHFNLTSPHNLTLEIIDLYGRVIKEKKIYADFGKSSISFSNESMSSGIYLARLKAEGSSTSKKFVLVR